LFERFTVIPSIDLKEGAVVRLVRGDMARATVYSRDPAAIAREFERAGAELIHVVDLDGAIAGEPRNLESIRAIRRATACQLDIGGGLRTLDAVRAAVRAGADYVSMGSAAVLNPGLLRAAATELNGRVFGSLDIREGRVAIRGWTDEASATSPWELARRFVESGVSAVAVTDVTRDGTGAGVGTAHEAMRLADCGLPVIASGGVASLDDIRGLRQWFDRGLVAVIVGRAIYDARVDLADAIRAAGTRRQA
jgi:phosphoribosylformimino-5-aminoimidazole carboxamide ribotide isomerase